MNKKKNLTSQENFSLAIQQHQKNNFQIAEKLYREVIREDPNHFESIFYLGTLLAQTKKFKLAKSLLYKAISIQPNFAKAHYNLGLVFNELQQPHKSISCYEKAVKLDPNDINAHYNLANLLREFGQYEKAINFYNKVIKIDHNHVDAHNNLGNLLSKLGQYENAIICYKKAIQINPNYADAYYNLGKVFRELGMLKKAIDCYKKVLKINPIYVRAHNNLGVIFQEFGETQKSIICYKKAIKINPNYKEAYWNLHSTSTNIDEALAVLKKLYDIDKKSIIAKIMISGLEAFKTNYNNFNASVSAHESNHPLTRSIKWVFSLPKLPKIYFDRWDFFNETIALADKSRSFYEFGVWNGISFQFLINTFKKGFGFDTFAGLPESWGDMPKGSYSSFGSIPKIEGGEFITGSFKDTLPKFFSKKRPLASIVNFDADLYSSTLCALNYANKVIDEKSILIFDEFLTHKNWEKDEYKALSDFCNNLGINYEVLAISFSSKQVAVRLKK